MEEKINTLVKCNNLTDSIIKKLKQIPEQVIDKSREKIFEKISNDLLLRGQLIDKLHIEGVDFNSEEYLKFQQIDSIMMELFEAEKQKIIKLSRKLGNNQKIIMKYLKK